MTESLDEAMNDLARKIYGKFGDMDTAFLNARRAGNLAALNPDVVADATRYQDLPTDVRGHVDKMGQFIRFMNNEFGLTASTRGRMTYAELATMHENFWKAHESLLSDEMRDSVLQTGQYLKSLASLAEKKAQGALKADTELSAFESLAKTIRTSVDLAGMPVISETELPNSLLQMRAKLDEIKTALDGLNTLFNTNLVHGLQRKGAQAEVDAVHNLLLDAKKLKDAVFALPEYRDNLDALKQADAGMTALDQVLRAFEKASVELDRINISYTPNERGGPHTLPFKTLDTRSGALDI